MSTECRHCRVLHWIDETVNGSRCDPEFNACCAGGRVVLPSIQLLPSTLIRLLTGQDQQSHAFRDQIRAHNSVLAFASLGAQIDECVTGQRGVYSFRIQVAQFHQMGALLPVKEEQARGSLRSTSTTWVHSSIVVRR